MLLDEAAVVLIGFLVGLPTDVIPNPVFGRPVPVTWWSYPVLVVTALLGGLLDLAWTGEMAGGVRVYTVAAYSTAFSVLVAGAIMGIACILLMRETRCRQSA